jgi:hypothetical protein
MGDFRIKYGSAFGPQNNFYVNSANVFTSTDTTPDVTNGTLWYSNNASATTITDFDLSALPSSGSNAPLFEGKRIIVVFLDAVTTITPNSRLVMAGSGSVTFPANSTLDLVYHNSAWIEIGRSINTTGDVLSQRIAGSNNAIGSVDNVKTVLLTGTAKAIIWSISGGSIGQRIDIVNNSTSGIVIEVTMGGNLMLMGTASFTMISSGVYAFVKAASNTWFWQKAAVA